MNEGTRPLLYRFDDIKPGVGYEVQEILFEWTCLAPPMEGKACTRQKTGCKLLVSFMQMDT